MTNAPLFCLLQQTDGATPQITKRQIAPSYSHLNLFATIFPQLLKRYHFFRVGMPAAINSCLIFGMVYSPV